MKLTINNIDKSFGDNHVLQDISFECNSGQAVGILGRNGAGKTTTIRIVMGVFGADSGEILIDGVPIDRNKIGIGYLPEERGLYPKKVILSQLIYFGMLKGMTKNDAIDSALYWLERLQMGSYAKKKLDTLSKGNQQKIQLVATLIANPDIVILDEPFSGLDPVNAMMLKDIVKELIASGKIVLFSSHQMNYIEEFCDSIAILNSGKIVLSGNIDTIKRSYERNKIIVKSIQASEIKTFVSTFVEDCTQKGDELMIKLKSASEKNELIKKICEQDFDIDQIKVHEPSLNDIFVEYTERGI